MNAPVAIVKKKNERSSTQNTPSEIRVAYPYFHEKRTKNAAGVPYTKKDGTPNPRYSATFMFPKLSSDPHQCPNYMFLWGLAVEAARKMWPQNVDSTGQWVWPTGAQFDVKNGDEPFKSKPKPGQPQPSAEEVAKKNAWRCGYWIVEVENFLDPGPRVAKVVNGQMSELPAKVINGTELYKGGDWGFGNVHAYAYEHETFGVNFGFDGFCFTREGERIGNNAGPRSAAQMFGSVAGMAAPGAVMPSAGPALPPAAPGPVAAPVAPPAAPVMAEPPVAPVAPPAAPMPPMPPAGAPALPPLPTR